jgi:hypothetical protein
MLPLAGAFAPGPRHLEAVFVDPRVIVAGADTSLPEPEITERALPIDERPTESPAPWRATPRSRLQEPPAASIVTEDEEEPLPFDYPEAPPAAEIPGLCWWCEVPGALVPRAGAPHAVPARKRDPHIAGRVLRRGLYERDKERGADLPASGAIAAALGKSVRGHTPAVSTGVFRAVVDAEGRLTAITVVGFMRGEAAGWQRAASDAQRLLAGRRFLLRSPFEHGAVVTIRIEQCMALPSNNGCLRWRAPPIEKDEWPFYSKPQPRMTVRGRPIAVPIDTDIAQIVPPNVNDLMQPAGPPQELEAGADVDVRLPGPNRRLQTVRGFDLSDIGASVSRRVSVFFSTNALDPAHRF